MCLLSHTLMPRAYLGSLCGWGGPPGPSMGLGSEGMACGLTGGGACFTTGGGACGTGPAPPVLLWSIAAHVLLPAWGAPAGKTTDWLIDHWLINWLLRLNVFESERPTPKPLSKPMLTYCQLDPKEHIAMKISFEIQIFTFKKMPLNMSSAKWRPFCPGEMTSAIAMPYL